jgi:hypothetical protein
MNMNPSNGENFYYFSEAWLKKKNFRQAEEFNRLAALHLRTDARWEARVAEQAERIRKARDQRSEARGQPGFAKSALGSVLLLIADL